MPINTMAVYNCYDSPWKRPNKEKNPSPKNLRILRILNSPKNFQRNHDYSAPALHSHCTKTE